MKLDRVFHHTTQSKLEADQKLYAKKYLFLSVVLTVLLVGSVLFVFARFPAVTKILDGDIISFIFIFAFMPLIVYFGGRALYINKAESELWSKIATDNRGTYSPGVNLREEESKMLTEGSTRSGHHEIVFTGEFGEKVRLFSYQFSFKKQATSTTRETYEYPPFKYLVIGFKFLGNFPHLYLNYKKNKYNLSIGSHLSLPTEFEKEFILSIPKGYQIEALDIFTPDILDAILRLGIKCDVELVKGEILFFIEDATLLKDFSKIENKIQATKEIARLLAPKLNRFKFSPIGNLSPRL